ncbi:putative protein OS=Streptomyces griseomycini OX=66895 GN=FHS37_007408 PE=4 SV=1 [Streptomyces griseomycini]|uniref:Uncharacterized protein n=1 Tax=Streptomyces griseomycini TaxID=66895 RepID=A0A7W7PY10_9ACTN|nr:hypothetical protein [Streptomyces griseomycini]GGR43572.1 hypothetical protein GCM10015536_56910 [Streptomyces griseomycini]
MAESLYDRYMAAARAYREHEQQCTDCSSKSRCETGRRLYESFARLQDAHLNWLRKRG